MHVKTSSVFTLAVIAGIIVDSGRVASASETEIAQTRNGTIEMRILGAGDDVRFFVDGNQVPARKRTASWYAAQAQVQVPAGEHKVEAQFRAPGRGRSGEWRRLATRDPVFVAAGRVTRLEADVRSAGDVPNDIVQYFQVDAPPATSAAAVSPAQVAPASAAVTRAAPPTITIHGTEVLSDGRSEAAPATATAAAADVLDVGTEGLPDHPLQVADLSPPAEEIAVVDAGRIEVALLVQSVPPGAEAHLDGKAIGKTPLHVRLDPRQDHLLTVARDGCESIVQLLSTDAWRSGRSPQTVVHLECESK